MGRALAVVLTGRGRPSTTFCMLLILLFKLFQSNWSADYFLYTGGIALGFTPSTADNKTDTQWTGTKLHKQLQNVFLRDWESPYASMDL